MGMGRKKTEKKKEKTHCQQFSVTVSLAMLKNKRTKQEPPLPPLNIYQMLIKTLRHTILDQMPGYIKFPLPNVTAEEYDEA